MNRFKFVRMKAFGDGDNDSDDNLSSSLDGRECVVNAICGRTIESDEETQFTTRGRERRRDGVAGRMMMSRAQHLELRNLTGDEFGVFVCASCMRVQLCMDRQSSHVDCVYRLKCNGKIAIK